MERPTSPRILEEYIRNDGERSTNVATYPVVYDYCDISPFYDNTQESTDPYIDENDAIELPSPDEQSEGAINEPY